MRVCYQGSMAPLHRQSYALGLSVWVSNSHPCDLRSRGLSAPFGSPIQVFFSPYSCSHELYLSLFFLV